ncbi:MAG: DNA adenine methylase [Thermodesulfobacteriota bacterium]
MQDSPVGWIGGKKLLRSEILKRFPVHTAYVEVFAGAAWLLFAKERSASKAEIVNDLNGDLANFYRCVREQPLELIEKLKWRLISQADFARERELSCGSEIERAARFFWRLKVAFGSRGRRASFGYHLTDLPRFRPERVWEVITRAHDRLKHVTVFSEDFARLIERLDRPETFFYCDPPYHGCEGCYEATFVAQDHERLAQSLKNCTGKFLLSYNDHEAIRELYSWATIEPVQTRYSVSRTPSARKQPRMELLIRNYEIAVDTGRSGGRGRRKN